MEEKEVIRVVNITKRFGEVTANENVNLTLRQGEIHAILGENGAGKSTLMNMLSGIYCPDSGSIYVRGKETRFRSPMDAIEQGIGMIHQHFKLVKVFTARENIIAGEKGRFILSPKKLSKQIQEITKDIGLDIDLDKKVYNMSVGEKQTVEILKVLYRGGDILILDEPTAVLTPQETKKLFSILKTMKQRGCAVVIITHKLHEVMEISDQVTVLRKGQTIITLPTTATNPKELTDWMVGKSVELTIERKEVEKQNPILKVDSLTVQNEEKVEVLQNICFTVYGGEILGVAGIAGSGQKELCEAIAGLQPVEEGSILYKGKNITGLSPREQYKRKIRIGFVPEDRLGMGLLPSMDLVDNLILRDYQKHKGIGLHRKPAASKAQELVERLQIKCPGLSHPIKLLSGGNIQKVLLGREISSAPEVLITAYPVRGLDIGASHTVYELLNEQKEKGVGILFVGEDLDVLLALCDRILVLCGGEITGIVDAKQSTKEQVGWMMAGQVLAEERMPEALVEGREEKSLVENQ